MQPAQLLFFTTTLAVAASFSYVNVGRAEPDNQSITYSNLSEAKSAIATPFTKILFRFALLCFATKKFTLYVEVLVASSETTSNVASPSPAGIFAVTLAASFALVKVRAGIAVVPNGSSTVYSNTSEAKPFSKAPSIIIALNEESEDFSTLKLIV